MSPRDAARRNEPERLPLNDPWVVVAYLLSGVLLYGVLGWLADRWLGTTYLVGVGVVLGAGLGLYLTWMRVREPNQPADSSAGGASAVDVRETGKTSEKERP